MKIKKSTIVPLLLLAYLAFMAYIGLPHLQAGRYAYYFGIIAITLAIIVALHFTLKYREKQKAMSDTKKKADSRPEEYKNIFKKCLFLKTIAYLCNIINRFHYEPIFCI